MSELLSRDEVIAIVANSLCAAEEYAYVGPTPCSGHALKAEDSIEAIENAARNPLLRLGSQLNRKILDLEDTLAMVVVAAGGSVTVPTKLLEDHDGLELQRTEDYGSGVTFRARTR